MTARKKPSESEMPTGLPADPEAETAIIGSILLAPECYSTIHLKTDDFYSPRNREIYAAITKQLGEEKLLDIMLLAPDLIKRGAITSRLDLAQFTSRVPHIENLQKYVKRVSDTANQRRLIRLGTRIITEAQDGCPLQIAASATEQLGKVTDAAGIKEPISLRQALQEYRSEKDQSAHPIGDDDYGLPGLGAALGGGLHWGGTILVGGAAKCVAGSTEISVNRASKGFKIRIEDAYRRFNGLDERKNYNWDRSIPTKCRALVDGVFHQHNVVGIHCNGEQDTIRVEFESGKSLELTPDHLVATPGGWIEAALLRPGQVVMANGQEACARCGSTEVVVSVKPAKRQPVYDIVMEDPWRNFVANGILVHNSGKTVLSMEILRAAMRFGTPVYIVSRDQLYTHIAARIWAGESGVDRDCLKTSAQALEVQQAMDNWPLYFHPAEFDLNTVCSYIRICAATKGIKVWVVDYLQRITVPDGSGKPSEDAVRVADRFSDLAQDTNTCGIVISRVTKPQQGMSTQHRFAGEAGVQNSCDGMIFIHKMEDANEALRNEFKPDCIRLIEVLAGRYNGDATVAVKLEGVRDRYVEYDRWSLKQKMAWDEYRR